MAQATVFTPAPDCMSTEQMHYIYTNPSSIHMIDGYYLLEGPLSTSSDCFPKDWGPTTYISPALCPSGYTPACETVSTAGTVSETIYTCCPTYQSFHCNPASLVPVPWGSFLGCASDFDTKLGTWLRTDVTQISSGTTSMIATLTQDVHTGGGLGAFSVEVRFQSSDLVAKSTTTTTASSSTTSPSSSTASSNLSSSTTATSTSTPVATQPSSGLSTGAIAGIAIGCVLAGVAFAALAMFLCLRRRKAHATRPEMRPLPPVQPYELPAKIKPIPHELDGKGRPISHPYELDVGPHG